MHNWARSHEFTGELHQPTTREELQDLVARSSAVRALGTGHSFHDIADVAGGVIVSLDRYRRGVTIVPGEDGQATLVVEGRVTYGQLGAFLDRAGYGLSNLASLPHISVVGACATGTHGSGDKLQNLAGAVVGVELVDAAGEVHELSRERCGDDFDGIVVALGALGVVTKMALRVVERFEIEQYVYDNLPLASLLAHFDEVMGSAYSVSLFTDWQRERINQVWCKALRGVRHVDLAKLGATPADGPRHPVMGSDAPGARVQVEKCTQQMGVPGAWYERLPHFRMEHEPSTGEELQAEYILPRANFAEAFGRIAELREAIRGVIQITEIRTIAADTMWLSPSFGRDSVGIHFTLRKDKAAVEELLVKVEEKLKGLEARPHWGKWFMMRAGEVAPLYPKLADFRWLIKTYDPRGKFQNAFLRERVLG